MAAVLARVVHRGYSDLACYEYPRPPSSRDGIRPVLQGLLQQRPECCVNDCPSTPNLEKKERQHKSSQAHVPFLESIGGSLYPPSSAFSKQSFSHGFHLVRFSK